MTGSDSGNRYCPGYGPPASSRDSSSSRRSRSRTTHKTPAVDPHLVPLGRAGCRSQAWLRRRVTARTKAFESPPVESDGLHLRIPPPRTPINGSHTIEPVTGDSNRPTRGVAGQTPGRTPPASSPPAPTPPSAPETPVGMPISFSPCWTPFSQETKRPPYGGRHHARNSSRLLGRPLETAGSTHGF